MQTLIQNSDSETHCFAKCFLSSVQHSEINNQQVVVDADCN